MSPLDLQLRVNAVRFAARLTDMPTSELDVGHYVEEVRSLHKRVLEERGVKLTVIQDNFMEASGFGGLWGVGKVITLK